MTELHPAMEQDLGRRSSLLNTINDYVTLTKPPIVLLLLITAAGGMFLAAQGVPSLPLMGLVWLGGSLASGGANALNHYLDRDIDQLMTRTRSRPVVCQRISPTRAVVFGITLNIIAFCSNTLGKKAPNIFNRIISIKVKRGPANATIPRPK